MLAVALLLFEGAREPSLTRPVLSPNSSARVMKDEMGVSRGFGFVSYHNPQDGASPSLNFPPPGKLLLTPRQCSSFLPPSPHGHDDDGRTRTRRQGDDCPTARAKEVPSGEVGRAEGCKVRHEPVVEVRRPSRGRPYRDLCRSRTNEEQRVPRNGESVVSQLWSSTMRDVTDAS